MVQWYNFTILQEYDFVANFKLRTKLQNFSKYIPKIGLKLFGKIIKLLWDKIKEQILIIWLVINILRYKKRVYLQ